MDELHNILTTHSSKTHQENAKKHDFEKAGPSVSEIPDVLFDDVLVKTKVNRIQILVLMYLYRLVWCRPNLHREYGIGPIMSYTELAKKLDLSIDEVYQSLVKLEELGFIETIRSGQYFVRRYFTQELDEKYGQVYGDF